MSFISRLISSFVFLDLEIVFSSIPIDRSIPSYIYLACLYLRQQKCREKTYPTRIHQ